jgi:hypothetical protein
MMCPKMASREAGIPEMAGVGIGHNADARSFAEIEQPLANFGVSLTGLVKNSYQSAPLA